MSQARNEGKRVYRSPSLKVYGGVLKLTASGTGSNNENPGATNQGTRQRP
jgi:hypothetical protein